MDHNSHTPMNMYSSCYNNPSTAVSSSSTQPSCFLFGVELFAKADQGKGKMVMDNSEGNELSKIPSDGQQEMTGNSVASGSENANLSRFNVELFPQDAKDLLSTGIFDGVFVAYGGSAREPDKRKFAMIEGASFLCACMICNGQKYVSARKLEHHAGYETKHPNSGIYFQSGISIFRAVERLRKTPRDKLLEEIGTISGSVINEANFEKWKVAMGFREHLQARAKCDHMEAR